MVKMNLAQILLWKLRGLISAFRVFGDLQKFF